MSSGSIHTFLVNGFVIGVGVTHSLNEHYESSWDTSLNVTVSVCGLSPSHTPFIPSNLFSSRFGSEEV